MTGALRGMLRGALSTRAGGATASIVSSVCSIRIRRERTPSRRPFGLSARKVRVGQRPIRPRMRTLRRGVADVSRELLCVLEPLAWLPSRSRHRRTTSIAMYAPTLCPQRITSTLSRLVDSMARIALAAQAICASTKHIWSSSENGVGDEGVGPKLPRDVPATAVESSCAEERSLVARSERKSS